MENEVEKQRQEVALFRYGLIGDLVHLPHGSPGLYAKIREKAAQDYHIPRSRRTNVAAETIRDWLGQWRAGGFDALMPKPRNDRGRSRTLPQEVADMLLVIKEQHPNFAVRQVIKEALARKLVPADQVLPLSTVHRLLARHGLMARRPGDPIENDRRHFEFQKAGDLWMSDVMHGPAIAVDGGRRRKAYLIAFLDSCGVLGNVESRS